MPSDKLLLAEHRAGLNYRALAAKFNLNPDSVRGRISREMRKHVEPPMLELERAHDHT